MAKQNLKSALANHNARKAQRAHEAKVEAAKQAKADSLKSGKGGGAKKQKKRQEGIRDGGEGGVVRNEGRDGEPVASTSAGTSKGKGKGEFPEPFEKDDTILLVGEGE